MCCPGAYEEVEKVRVPDCEMVINELVVECRSLHVFVFELHKIIIHRESSAHGKIVLDIPPSPRRQLEIKFVKRFEQRPPSFEYNMHEDGVSNPEGGTSMEPVSALSPYPYSEGCVLVLTHERYTVYRAI